MQGIILKLVDSIKSFTAQLNIIRNETTAVKDQINSIKKKNELQLNKQINTTSNKQLVGLKVMNNSNKKWSKVDKNVPSDHDMLDLESKVITTHEKLFFLLLKPCITLL